MEKRTIDFSTPQYRKLEQDSEALGISLSELVRRLVDQRREVEVERSLVEKRKDAFIAEAFRIVPLMLSGDPVQRNLAADQWSRIADPDILPKPQDKRKTR